MATEVEFDAWNTIIEHGKLHIVSLRWGTPDFWLNNYVSGKRYVVPDIIPNNGNDLTIYVLHEPTSSIYEINVEYLSGFRLLDEGGLLEIWHARKELNLDFGINTLKVRNHGWSKESWGTFFLGNKDEWSHMIATENECVEIVCQKSPAISKYCVINAEDIESNNSVEPIKNPQADS